MSFNIEDGQFVGVIGHTGSGKSTMIQHLNGLLKPTEGSIIVDGIDLTAEGVSMIDIRKRVGLVFSIRSISYLKKLLQRTLPLALKISVLMRRK